MNPNITDIDIFKNEKRRMSDYGDMMFSVEGGDYNTSCYVRDIEYKSVRGRKVIKDVGLSGADIRWIAKTARELFKDPRHDSVQINMKTMKMCKY